MTTPSDAPLFDVDAPAPLTPVERLLALADLYTQHNDLIDTLFSGRTPQPDPDAYAASARRLEREALAAIKAVRQQPLPAIDSVKGAVVRLKQLTHLTGGATRYLTAAQHVRPPDDAQHQLLDPRHGVGQYVQLARELTALAPLTIIGSAMVIAGRLPSRARSTTTVPGMTKDHRAALLEVARGHIAVTEYDGNQRVYHHETAVDAEMLSQLEAQVLVIREPASAAPFFTGGPLRDRARLTAHGISALSTVVVSPLPASRPAVGPVAAPTTVNSSRARR
ncbi:MULTISPECIES: hypothetical protein [unclassified Streptomyces]|uniref:hypothetical protein n=1 Tax=unclassified Streptomyces TaxID=2593676 RepID=UPI0023669826|nr:MULTISPECIES: hypothetical protein [unclassified Streptomyces]MDF3140894.1 hypothetical protein [Streptomyces sp. T21Q-yed]WDF43502.1 hypothetical protein PBV52_45350 [Streptomyces sp. T12]